MNHKLNIMLESTLLLVFIGGLFLLTAWIDKKVDKKSFSKYTVNFGVILMIAFLLLIGCLVEQIINYLILKIC